jgi:hypothetical protein
MRVLAVVDRGRSPSALVQSRSRLAGVRSPRRLLWDPALSGHLLGSFSQYAGRYRFDDFASGEEISASSAAHCYRT